MPNLSAADQEFLAASAEHRDALNSLIENENNAVAKFRMEFPHYGQAEREAAALVERAILALDDFKRLDELRRIQNTELLKSL